MRGWLRTADFDYVLPPELIAQTPLEARSDARLLVLARASGTMAHRRVSDLPVLLHPHDLLVLNDTRVLPARLFARRPTGGRVELLLLQPEPDSYDPAHPVTGGAQGAVGAVGAGRLTTDQSGPPAPTAQVTAMPAAVPSGAAGPGRRSGESPGAAEWPGRPAAGASAVWRALARPLQRVRLNEPLTVETARASDLGQGVAPGRSGGPPVSAASSHPCAGLARAGVEADAASAVAAGGGRPAWVVPGTAAPVTVEITAVLGDGLVRVVFHGLPPTADGVPDLLRRHGVMPLPPYIHARLQDPERYQTVYARHDGSAAAPTAGLHFTPTLLGELGAAGIAITYVTLHVGLGTFRPVSADRPEQHRMHAEWFCIPESAATAIAACRRRGGRVIAVGTTVTRTLEAAAIGRGEVKPGEGWTDLYILPGRPFAVIDGLMTNFHLPRSTLLMLVAAFAGREPVLAAYAEAVARRYRFFSFGDAMLLI